MASHIKYDFDAVASVVFGVEDSELRTLLGDGWLGHYGVNDGLDIDSMSSDLEHPVCFARRSIEYSGDPQQMLDGGDVIRRGAVRLLFFVQRDARDELAIEYQDRMETAFLAASDGESIAYLPGTPVPAQYTEDGAWALFLLEIPFIATGMDAVTPTYWRDVSGDVITDVSGVPITTASQ